MSGDLLEPGKQQEPAAPEPRRPPAADLAPGRLVDPVGQQKPRRRRRELLDQRDTRHPQLGRQQQRPAPTAPRPAGGERRQRQPQHETKA